MRDFFFGNFWRERKFGSALSGLYQLTLSLPSFQLTFGTLPSE